MVVDDESRHSSFPPPSIENTLSIENTFSVENDYQTPVKIHSTGN